MCLHFLKNPDLLPLEIIRCSSYEVAISTFLLILAIWNFSGYVNPWFWESEMCVCVCMHVKSLQLCPTLCDPVDCSPSDSCVHEILQAGILERLATPSSRESSRPRNRTHISRIAGRRFTVWATREGDFKKKPSLGINLIKGKVRGNSSGVIILYTINY